MTLYDRILGLNQQTADGTKARSEGIVPPGGMRKLMMNEKPIEPENCPVFARVSEVFMRTERSTDGLHDYEEEITEYLYL